MFKKLLILSASAGAGHVRAAEAIEKAVKDLGAAKEVRHIDVLELTTKVFRAVYSKAYIDMVNKMPQVLGWLYDQMDTPWENERLRLALDKLNTRRFVKLLETEEPDLCISTHFLPSEIISWLRAKERLAARQAIVVTDFDVHAMWLCRHFEQYFVALDETKVLLEKLGIAWEVAANGEEAIEALKKSSFDLVLMDVQMPVMDGLEATLAIRKLEALRGTHVPIVALTANVLEEHRREAHQAGFDDYLAKPVKLEDLRARLQKWAPARVNPASAPETTRAP